MKKGFTLIELLAVIIILGILMLIAIPSVTNYINNSRKETYVDTIKELIKGASTLVNSGDLDIYDTNTTYYIPVSAINIENGKPKSPYGELDDAYVVVTYDGEEYEYYFVGKDTEDIGINIITIETSISKDEIVNNVVDVDTTVGIDGKEYVVVFNNDCQPGTSQTASRTVAGEYYKGIVCKKATRLHTATCLDDYNKCRDIVGPNNTIIYGTIVEGELKTGDAFDCDVNYNGSFNYETERFYYLYDDGENAYFIYYTDLNDHEKYMYYELEENYHGPLTAYQYLPSKDEWPNPGLIKPGKRQIINALGNSSTNGTPLDIFDYGDKVARLPTMQEVTIGCPSDVADACLFLVEDVAWFEKNTSGTHSYWTETPLGTELTNIKVVGHDSKIWTTLSTIEHPVRPLITVSISNIEY